MHRKSTANPEATDMNDQPMDDKPRRNLATIARKVLRHVYEYIKVDIKSGEALRTFVKMQVQAGAIELC